MKQLTIFCGRDLEGRVITALDHAGIEGFFKPASSTGNRFLPQGEVPRTMTWDATMFVVPAAEESRVEVVLNELREHADSCEIEPCLRAVVSPVDRAL